MIESALTAQLARQLYSQPHPEGSSYRETSRSIASITAAPGFEFCNFELADPQALISQHPEHAAIIRRLSEAIVSAS